MSRRIHCDIVDIPSSPPILYVDPQEGTVPPSERGGAYAGVYDNPDGTPNPNRVSFHLCDDDHPGWGSKIVYGTKSLRYSPTPTAPGDYEGPALITQRPPVPVPTRAQVCGVQMIFAGLTVTTQQFGTLPWFEPAYQCLTGTQDRATVRATKKAAGDTHLILEFFTDSGSIYDEPGQPYQRAISKSGEQNPQWFLDLVQEVREDGLIPVVAFDGDNADAPLPAHGHANAMRQLPILVNLLKDWNYEVLYGRLWDGVFSPTASSSPENIQAFGTAFRQLLPLGFLGIEHGPGYIPVGGGPADYAPGGKMDAYDVVMGEYNQPPNDDATWQVLGRMIRPYTRPPDQPQGDDLNPPFYLVDSPRGPRYYIAFETGEYEFVRGQISVDTLKQQGQYLRNMGAKFVCLP